MATVSLPPRTSLVVFMIAGPRCAVLGLALVKSLVEAQGGRVTVRSVPGKGSVFSAVLPRVSPLGSARMKVTGDSTPIVTAPGS